MDSLSLARADLAFVIPARNEADFVGAAVRSVVEQTIPLERLELIVVENGSADDTAGAARRAADQALGLPSTIIGHAPAGIAAAKNRGAREARARVLVFLDADSRASPELAQGVLDWVARDYPAGSIKVVADSRDWLDRAFFDLIDWGKGLFGIHANMLYCERELFLRSGGFGEQIRLAEDPDFMIRLERQGVRLCHVNDASIATSPRRLHELPFRLGLFTMFGRWTLAHLGIGRRWRY
jgi:glycosyltransferase involved in cell wall biosynthesis